MIAVEKSPAVGIANGLLISLALWAGVVLIWLVGR